MAEDMWERMAAEYPDRPEALYGLGTRYAQLDLTGTAIALLTRAVTIAPDSGEIWLQLGLTLRKVQQTDSARYAFERSISLLEKEISKAEPAKKKVLKAVLGAAYAGMAGSYINSGNPKRGLDLATKALELRPDYVHAVNTLALCNLELGNWEEGWKLYDNRHNIPGYHVRDFGDIPRWEGQRVKCMALTPEQGLGDEILFASVVPDVMKDVDAVVAEFSPRLLELFGRSFGIPCYGTERELKAAGHKIDAWERMASLPIRYRKKPDDCPGTPYLKADPVKVAGYRARMAALGPGPYIGVAWKGGTAQTHERLRNPPRALFAKLVAQIPGTKVSLQYGKDAPRHAEEIGVTHWPVPVSDMDEFAALVAACDSVVTICQTAVHMAGALGVPTHCLVPTAAAWRYLGGGEKRMPWYGSVTLHRQRDDDWEPAFESVRKALSIPLAEAAE